MSQEELGEKVFVTRQTISSWENDKTYPDINSLILLSQVFDMTIDNLVKGDLEIMEKKIEKNDIKAMNRYGWSMTIGMVITVIILPLSWYLGFIPGLVMAVLTFAATMYCAAKAENIKKQYDVQTYCEIVAFLKGDTLDEIAKVRESGKRKYQKFLLAVCCGIFALIVSQIIWFILHQI
ncbi:MAG: helix-turn-helix domain-containing protein [Defluviitaleaceae bacterium]|nr:helix-turn-helix domain-containing protein [Defluviitaleaceae bacterium]